MAAETAIRDADFVPTMMAVQLGNSALSANLWIDETTHRLLVNATNTPAAGNGRTLLSSAGSVASNGDNTILTAGTNKLKVFAFSLTTTSTTAVVCQFKNGTGGSVLYEYVLQAPSNVNVGANLAVDPPAFLFATGAATLLNLHLDGAQTVHYSVSYFEEA